MNTKRKKNMGFDHIGTVMNLVVDAFYKNADQGLLKIYAAWQSIVNEAIAQNTKPSAMKGKVLIINVSSSIWLHELHFMKNDLIRRINQTVGATMVEELKFKIGPV